MHLSISVKAFQSPVVTKAPYLIANPIWEIRGTDEQISG